jgi:hypothetical protein
MTAPARRPPSLRVEVSGVPHPGLLRIAIAERLAGRPFAGVAEDTVGRAVERAARAELDGGRRPWR